MTIPAKSKIFTAAWTVARQGATKFGGSARAYFAEALRQAWAFIRKHEVPAAPVGKTAAEKVDLLAAVVMDWSRKCRGSFAYNFIVDNAERVARFGDKTMFSAKQVAIIDEMYAKYC